MITTGRGITIARGLSDPNRYVGSVRLNGRPLRRGYIRHDELLAGGTLEFPHVADANSEMGHRYE